MARYPHIPGIPLMGPGGLRGLTRASEFVTMPRAPVHFLKNTSSRPAPPAPVRSAIPRPAAPFERARPLEAPGAPRRVAFRDVLVSSLPFPRLAAARAPAPPTPAQSPLRFTYWETPSLSKEGVRRAYINRRLPVWAPSPSPSRIPVPRRLLQGAPRKHVAFSVAAAVPSFEDALTEPAAPSPCKPKRARFAVAPSPAPASRGGACSRRSASSLRSILVQSRPADEVRAKKSVRFGDVAVRDVDYWIDRKTHVFFDGGLWKMGKLTGWRVTPLDKPSSEGELERYTTLWGSENTSMFYHTNMPKCQNPGCHWSSIAYVYKSYMRQGVHLWDRHDLVLYAWSELRERERQKGHWLL